MAHKIRLGLYLYTVEIGGTEKHIYDLLSALDKDIYEITIFCNRWTSLERFLDLDELSATLKYVPLDNLYEPGDFIKNVTKTPFLIKRVQYRINYYLWQNFKHKQNRTILKETFEAHPVDILHIHNGGYPGAFTALWASIAAEEAGIKHCLMTIHNKPQSYRFAMPSQKQIDYYVQQSLDQTICVSNFVRQQLVIKRDFPKERTSVIYNGFSAPKLDSGMKMPFSLNQQKNIIAVVARLVPNKGHIYLLQALSVLKSELKKDLIVLIVGDGVLRHTLEKHSVKLGLKDVVQFIGSVQHNIVLKIIEASDIVVLPSLDFESFGYTNIEAMSLRKPVISTYVGGIPEVVKDGETGMLVPPRDSDNLTQAIEYLLENPQERTRMGKRGFERYKTLFTLDTMIAEYHSLYQSYYGK